MRISGFNNLDSKTWVNGFIVTSAEGQEQWQLTGSQSVTKPSYPSLSPNDNRPTDVFRDKLQRKSITPSITLLQRCNGF